MPCFMVELHPEDLTPADVSPTRQLLTPNVLMEQLVELETRLPGAKIRAIALLPHECNELKHYVPWPTDGRRETLFSLPLLDWHRIPKA